MRDDEWEMAMDQQTRNSRLAEPPNIADQFDDAKAGEELQLDQALMDEAREVEREMDAPKLTNRDRAIREIKHWAATHDGKPPTSTEWTNAQMTPSLFAIKREGWTWADAVEAAGFERPKRGGNRATRKPSTARNARRLAEKTGPTTTRHLAKGPAKKSALDVSPLATLIADLTVLGEELEEVQNKRVQLMDRFAAKLSELDRFIDGAR